MKPTKPKTEAELLEYKKLFDYIADNPGKTIHYLREERKISMGKIAAMQNHGFLFYTDDMNRWFAWKIVRTENV